jgi:hypothetical protein
MRTVAHIGVSNSGVHIRSREFHIREASAGVEIGAFGANKTGIEAQGQQSIC